MRNFFRTIGKLLIITPFIICLSSCGLNSITSEYSFEDLYMKDVSLEKLGDGKVMFYNNVNLMHTLDNTGRLNVWIDDKPAGQIRGGEYIIYKVDIGKHKVRLLHIDMANIRSSHEFYVDETTKVVKIKATIVSNDFSVTNILPDNFSKFKHAPYRK